MENTAKARQSSTECIPLAKWESFATMDGPGTRCVAFTCGCPLRCVYCHNPETQTGEHCRMQLSPQELVDKVRRLKPYFGEQGGLTWSGGEPLLYARAIAACAPLLKQIGVGYWLDTSGAVVLTQDVQDAVCQAQGVILDLKMPTSEWYQRYCQADMSLVMQFASYLTLHRIPTWIRTVIVPGINDTSECIRTYAMLVKDMPNVIKYELLGFHTMGFSKYEQLGMCNPLVGTPAMDAVRLERLQQELDRYRGGDQQ